MRRLMPLWIVILVLIVAVIYLPGASKYLRLKRREVELSREIERLKIQIAELKKEEHLLKTDLARLEEVVREELGLIKPGEIVVKVVEEEIPEAAVKETNPT
ncbi:MAG: septum formation initiator family protein [Candidatus Omnitrophica bacterium]|nr:septum formation initiator family protein [Candidatus Omnitrophota bacterium]